ncbi:MAG: hypothetical protein AB7Q29_15405 [Vicinamibacterales bacterium]
MRPDPDEVTTRDETAELEKALIAEYLEQRGHTYESLRALPEDAAHAILKAASLHASARLSEVEARAHYVNDLKRR